MQVAARQSTLVFSTRLSFLNCTGLVRLPSLFRKFSQCARFSKLDQAAPRPGPKIASDAETRCFRKTRIMPTLPPAHKTMAAVNNFSLHPSGGGTEVLGVTFLVQEVLLGVGFVLAAFGTLALILFRDVAIAQSSQYLSAEASSNWRRKARAAGYTLVFLGAANLAIVHVVMHVLAGAMTFCEGLFWRSVATLIVSVAGCSLLGVELMIDFDVFQWICLPCLLHCTSIMLVFIGLSSLPASEATTLYATYPFWALVFTLSIVQEPVGALAVAGIVGAFIGTTLIVQPFVFLGSTSSFDWAHTSSALLTVAGAALTGMLAITIRRMGVRVHYMMLSAWMSVYGIGLALALPLIQGKGPLMFDGVFASYAEQSSYFMICLALFMVCSCVSLLSLNWALQLENAGSISMIQVGILISFQWILDISMGSGTTNSMSIAGILLVLVSCFFIYISRTGELKEFDSDYSHLDGQVATADLLPAPEFARGTLVHGERYET